MKELLLLSNQHPLEIGGVGLELHLSLTLDKEQEQDQSFSEQVDKSAHTMYICQVIDLNQILDLQSFLRCAVQQRHQQ